MLSSTKMVNKRFLNPEYFSCFSHTDDNELRIQLDVFEDERLKDEDDYTTPEGIDLNSHVDIFHALLKQVNNSTQ
jgi:hypothetical protein